MGDEVKGKIADYLAAHRHMALGTAGPDGKPLVHTVGYVSEGTTVYFVTFTGSRKYHNLTACPHVAYVVDEDYPTWHEIRGVQMQGEAAVVDDMAEADRIVRMILEKFPSLPELPPVPEVAIIRVTPTEGFFLDYSKGFNYREGTTF